MSDNSYSSDPRAAAYKCKFCDKSFVVSSLARDHEKECEYAQL